MLVVNGYLACLLPPAAATLLSPAVPMHLTMRGRRQGRLAIMAPTFTRRMMMIVAIITTVKASLWYTSVVSSVSSNSCRHTPVTSVRTSTNDSMADRAVSH